MIPKNIQEITLDDLKSLIENKVSESRTLDYKVALNFDKPRGKAEFVADVIAFANTQGGDIIYGVNEEEGIPTDIVGISIENPDALKSRIENIIRDTTIPRVQGLQFRFIHLEDKKFVFILRIPQSLFAPHAYRDNHLLKFYARNVSGKYLMDYHELKIAFTFSGSISERARDFKMKRLMEILSEGVTKLTEKDISNSPYLVIHFIPLGSLVKNINLDIFQVYNVLKAEKLLFEFTYRYNIDGLQFPYQYGEYYQIYRNGIMESVSTNIFRTLENGLPYIAGYGAEANIFQDIGRFIKISQVLNLLPPFIVMISLLRVKGYYIYWGNVLHYPSKDDRKGIDRDHIHLPEVLINEYDEDLEELLKDPINAMWNAAGYAHSVCYPPDGTRPCRDKYHKIT